MLYDTIQVKLVEVQIKEILQALKKCKGKN